MVFNSDFQGFEIRTFSIGAFSSPNDQAHLHRPRDQHATMTSQ